MNRILYILIFLLPFLATELQAQTAGKSKPDSTQTASGSERVQSLKVAFITKGLSLTPAEAEKFWPVYNEYQDKREAVRKKMQENYKKIREQADELTNEELLRLSDEILQYRKQDVDLQLELHEKLKKILPPKKLAQLYVVEEDFKKELLRILTEEKESSKNQKGNQK